MARRIGADLVVLDPVLPLGLVGPRLGLPYAVVIHGAEVALPGRLPGGRPLVSHVLRHSTLAVSAGGYPATEARRAVPRRTDAPGGGGPPGGRPRAVPAAFPRAARATPVATSGFRPRARWWSASADWSRAREWTFSSTRRFGWRPRCPI